MATTQRIVFSFGYGTFCYGWHEFRIEETGDGLIASLSSMWIRDGDFVRSISVEQLDELEAFLRTIGVQDWLRHYSNPDTLDGTQWRMEYGGIGCSGSNAFPQGFFALTRYLADHFGCACFVGEGKPDMRGDGIPLENDRHVS